MNNQMLNVGDILVRPKLLGLVEHEGVVLGVDTVFTNTPGCGEHLTTIEEFAAHQPVHVQRTNANPIEVIARVKNMLRHPRGYDAVVRNCQHSATDAVYGKAKSRQVMNALLLVTLIGVLAVLLAPRRA